MQTFRPPNDQGQESAIVRLGSYAVIDVYYLRSFFYNSVLPGWQIFQMHFVCRISTWQYWTLINIEIPKPILSGRTNNGTPPTKPGTHSAHGSTSKPSSTTPMLRRRWAMRTTQSEEEISVPRVVDHGVITMEVMVTVGGKFCSLNFFWSRKNRVFYFRIWHPALFSLKY